MCREIPNNYISGVQACKHGLTIIMKWNVHDIDSKCLNLVEIVECVICATMVAKCLLHSEKKFNCVLFCGHAYFFPRPRFWRSFRCKFGIYRYCNTLVKTIYAITIY
jgi:hypothetical protein